MSKKTTVESDRLTRFLFEDLAVRGELVVLGNTYQAILENHDYPEPVKHLLGELLAVTCLLTATLKFQGNITVQLHGDGPLNLAVINGNNQQQMRGIARIKGDIRPGSTFKEMIGKGYIVITISPEKGEKYQGIVELEKASLTECIEQYFIQSEQLATKLFLRIGTEKGRPMEAGILLQVLPSAKEVNTDFEHLATLTETVKAEELFTLPPDEVLYRLYHQENVRLFDDTPVSFQCGCSRERCLASLATLSDEDINAILTEQGNAEVLCDYCGKRYNFDSIDLTQLRQNGNHNSGTVH